MVFPFSHFLHDSSFEPLPPNISFSNKPSYEVVKLGSSCESLVLLKHTSSIALVTPLYATIC